VKKNVLNFPLTALENILFHKIVADHMNVQPDDEVMEVGCGSGYSLYWFSHRVKSIWGIDLSEPTINFLSEEYKKWIHAKRVSVKHADICSPDCDLFKCAQFHKIFSVDVFEHVVDVEAMCRSIEKLLRPGGSYVMTFPNYSNHGRNYFRTADELRLLFQRFSNLRILVVKEGFFYKFLYYRIYLRLRQIFKSLVRAKPDHEYKYFHGDSSLFHEYSCFQTITHPRWYHPFIKIFFKLFILVASITPLYHVEDNFGSIIEKRLLIIARK
jgi:SAM-dependent methyltransferase